MDNLERKPEEFLAFSLEIGALELLPEGRELKSGRISPYFFNSGLFNSGKGIDVLAYNYALKIASMGMEPDYVFGPAYKGIPLCATVALQYYRITGKDIKFIFDRKEKKDHGDKGIFVGFPEGQESFNGGKVAIVDDVMTSGGSGTNADEMIRTFDGIPVCCVIGMDRQERGIDSDLSAVQMFTEKTGVPVGSVINAEMLLDTLKNGAIGTLQWTTYQKLYSYRNQYGVS